VADQNLPPNHLGVNVPEGFSTDFATSQAPNSTSPSASKGKMAEEQNQTVQNASSDGVDEGKFGQGGLLDPNRSKSGPSVGQLRGSRASMSAPTKERIFNPHATNPGRIPTAGGVAVGSKQYEQRRASRVSSDMGVGDKSPPQSPPPVAEESQAETSKDGAVNGAAAPPVQQEAAPLFATPSYDKDSEAPDAHAPEGAPAAAPVGETTPAQEQDKSTTEEMKDKVQEKLPSALGGSSTGGTSSTSPSSPAKERRGSRFDAFKDKLGLGSKK
jgi:hypothetical protein